MNTGQARTLKTGARAIKFQWVFLVAIALAGPVESFEMMWVKGEAGREATSGAFACSDKVFAYLSLTGEYTFPVAVRFRWLRPDGEIQEETHVSVAGPSRPATEIFSWLKIQGGDRVFGEFAFGGDYGADRQAFYGEWIVVASIREKEIGRQNFQVACF